MHACGAAVPTLTWWRPRALRAPLRRSDAGGASFLAELLEAVEQQAEGRLWELPSIPRPHVEWEAALAAGQPHALPPLALPPGVPLSAPEGAGAELAGALALEAYPPRGIIRFLNPQHTLGERPLIERIVSRGGGGAHPCAGCAPTRSFAAAAGSKLTPSALLSPCTPPPPPPVRRWARNIF